MTVRRLEQVLTNGPGADFLTFAKVEEPGAYEAGFEWGWEGHPLRYRPSLPAPLSARWLEGFHEGAFQRITKQ